jgi:hypothetical protein
MQSLTYPTHVQHVWPWSYNKCGEIDHLKYKQEISACEDNPGFGLLPNQGRGAPEIGTLSTYHQPPLTHSCVVDPSRYIRGDGRARHARRRTCEAHDEQQPAGGARGGQVAGQAAERTQVEFHNYLVRTSRSA